MTAQEPAARSIPWTSLAFVLAVFVAVVPAAAARPGGAGSAVARASYPPSSGRPPYPSALVSLASVSNGCGPGKPSDKPQYADDSEFVDSELPFSRAAKYRVDFRLACNLHDAGYTGAEVADPINGGFVDYFGWTKAQVDDKFLDDMRKLCEKIPQTAAVARTNCKQNGGFHSVSGAKSRYNFVKVGGLFFFKTRPNLNGTWIDQSNRQAPGWTIVQKSRDVTATWTGDSSKPGLPGRFDGVIVSHDEGDVVVGTMKLTRGGTTVSGTMRFILRSHDEFDLTYAQAGSAAPATLVDDKTPGRYNGALGNALNGTQPQFPPTKNEAGPTRSSARAPNLSAVSGVLGGWLANPPTFTGSWSGPQAISARWPIGSEDAIVYELDGPITGAVASFGVDNGIYVWVNGRYVFGAFAPGGVIPGEYTVNLGALPAGKNHVQILREDHGGRDGYTVEIRGTARTAGTGTMVRKT